MPVLWKSIWNDSKSCLPHPIRALDHVLLCMASQPNQVWFCRLFPLLKFSLERYAHLSPQWQVGYFTGFLCVLTDNKTKSVTREASLHNGELRTARGEWDDAERGRLSKDHGITVPSSSPPWIRMAADPWACASFPINTVGGVNAFLLYDVLFLTRSWLQLIFL